MDTKKLRQKVLDLAIHGKLVKQDPNDEPASILLDRIRAEKARLVKEGKIKKNGRAKLKIVEQSVILPNSWEWVRLDEICDIKGGKRIPRGLSFSDKPTSHIYIRVTNMKNCSIQSDELKYIDDEIYEKIKNYTISKNDLYLTIAGTIGNVGIVPSMFDGMNLTENAAKLTNIQIDKKYLMYALLTTESQEQFYSRFHQVAQPKLSIETASSTIFPLPPLAEQHRIVKAVDELFEQIDIIERSEKELEEAANKTRDKLLNLAIQGHLVPQDPNEEPASVLLERIRAEKARLVKEGKLKKKDLEEKPISPDEIPFDIPEGWEWCRLGDYNEIITGSTPSKSNPEFFGKDYPFYKPGDLISKFITNSDDGLSTVGYTQTRKLPKDSILVCCIGSLGKSSIIKREGSCNQQINAILPSQIFIVDYLYYSINSPYFVQEMWNKSASTTVTILNKANFSDILIPLPPLSEQRRIVTKLEELLHEIDKLKG